VYFNTIYINHDVVEQVKHLSIISIIRQINIVNTFNFKAKYYPKDLLI